MWQKSIIIFLGIAGIVFYLVSSGCATYNYGWVAGNELGRSAPIRTIYIQMGAGQTNERSYLEILKSVLKRDGYVIVEESDRADLKIDLNYKLLTVFGVGKEMDATLNYLINGQNYQRHYRSQYVANITEMIEKDIKSLGQD